MYAVSALLQEFFKVCVSPFTFMACVICKTTRVPEDWHVRGGGPCDVSQKWLCAHWVIQVNNICRSKLHHLRCSKIHVFFQYMVAWLLWKQFIRAAFCYVAWFKFKWISISKWTECFEQFYWLWFVQQSVTLTVKLYFSWLVAMITLYCSNVS